MGNSRTNQLKTFVIDTNVFIHKHDAILSFRDNEVVVPLWVLEELDSLIKAVRKQRKEENMKTNTRVNGRSTFI